MRILITSGGTTVPIDPIRCITNMSTGRFGAALANAALCAHLNVTYLTSHNGKSPFSTTFDFYSSTDLQDHIDHLKKLSQFSNTYRLAYQEYRYNHFDEYATLLQKIIQTEQPNIILLAAAVSDYLVDHYSDKKIRTKHQLQIELSSAPKIIHSVREWSKHSFIVGFKLLVDATESQLLEAALRIIHEHQLDLVIANDLSSIKRGAHQVLLVEPNGSYQTLSENIAPAVIENIIKRCS